MAIGPINPPSNINIASVRDAANPVPNLFAQRFKAALPPGVDHGVRFRPEAGLPSGGVHGSRDSVILETPQNELEDALLSNEEKNLFFPEDIQTLEYWMCFRINQFDLTRKEDFPIKTDLKRIFLPVPLNLGTQYGQNYNTESLGLAGLEGIRTGDKLRSIFTDKGNATPLNSDLLTKEPDPENREGSVVDKIYQTGVDALKGMFSMESLAYYGLQGAEQIAAAVGAKLGGIPGAIAGAAASQFVKGAIAGGGVAFNPYMAVMYNSPQFRTHQFSWKLIAKSQKESDAIKDIIYAFKYAAAPGIASNFNKHFFSYPNVFDIDLHYSNYLFNIAPSVLTNMEVSYHGEGYPAYHDIGNGEDKAPVSITLQCTFQETSIVTKETILSENR